jgi:hypothetical protein
VEDRRLRTPHEGARRVATYRCHVTVIARSRMTPTGSSDASEASSLRILSPYASCYSRLASHHPLVHSRTRTCFKPDVHRRGQFIRMRLSVVRRFVHHASSTCFIDANQTHRPADLTVRCAQACPNWRNGSHGAIQPSGATEWSRALGYIKLFHEALCIFPLLNSPGGWMSFQGGFRFVPMFRYLLIPPSNEQLKVLQDF